jgi:hypothetical protein
MLNQLCVEKNAHQWGVCLQICANCGVKDLITVNLCEDDRAYFCYTCTKQKATATISGNVTINGKTMWTVKSFDIDGNVNIYRYVETKNSRRMITRKISPTKLKKWGN